MGTARRTETELRMLPALDRNEGLPIWKQVVDGLKTLIARGDLREGMTLPTVRKAAGQLGVGVNAIGAAYRELQDEGFLAVRRGAGAVVCSPGAAAKPSKTAVIVLQLRALGTKLPDRELGNPDFLAERFLGVRERAVLAEMRQPVYPDMDFTTAWKRMPEILRRVFLHVLARTPMIDDALREAVAAGATQVVILGAGYDSRAYRLQGYLGATTVFELDSPATQEHKKRRVAEVVGQVPNNVVYVPVDLANCDLATALEGAGYRRDQRTFFIWEGVTMYMPESAVDAILRFVAGNSAPGSAIIFDYEYERAIAGDHADEVLKASQARLAKIREPHIFGVPGDSAREFVERRGLVATADLGPEQVTLRYLTRTDGTKLGDEPWSSGICIAEVPAKSSAGRRTVAESFIRTLAALASLPVPELWHALA